MLSIPLEGSDLFVPFFQFCTKIAQTPGEFRATGYGTTHVTLTWKHSNSKELVTYTVSGAKLIVMFSVGKVKRKFDWANKYAVNIFQKILSSLISLFHFAKNY